MTSISFRHGYYLHSKAACFEVRPSPEAQATMLNHGLLFKRYAEGFVLAGEKKTHPISPNSEISITLKLEIYVHDSTFYTVTESLPKNLNNSIFYFRNTGDLKTVEGEQLLHASPFVAEHDLMQTYDAAKKNNFLGYIILAITPSLQKNYTIRFQEKQSYWKYIIVSPHYVQAENIMIGGQGADFRGPFEVELQGRKKARVFISNEKLSMREQYSRHFQLIEKPISQQISPRILIQALPTPLPCNISQASKENEQQHESYSEIII